MDIFILIDYLSCISKMVHYMACIISKQKVFLVELFPFGNFKNLAISSIFELGICFLHENGVVL